jgi:putative transposase
LHGGLPHAQGAKTVTGCTPPAPARAHPHGDRLHHHAGRHQSDTKLSLTDAAIRQTRKDLDHLTVLPAQAAQAVLKTCLRAWVNCWEGRAEEPTYKGRFRSAMSVDIPQGRDLDITRVHRRWGMVNTPKVGRVRIRWTEDLPVGSRANEKNRITGGRLVKHALGWHIAFRVQTLERAPEPHQGPEVGVDA